MVDCQWLMLIQKKLIKLKLFKTKEKIKVIIQGEECWVVRWRTFWPFWKVLHSLDSRRYKPGSLKEATKRLILKYKKALLEDFYNNN
jgi:hypothetical protein